MRLAPIILALLVSSCSLMEADSILADAKRVAAVADQVVSVLDPRLSRVEGTVDGLRAGVEAVSDKRESVGVPRDSSLSLSEWLTIILGGVSGLLGVNVVRDRKYVRVARSEKSNDSQGPGGEPEGRA